MAEAIFNQLGKGEFQAFSAGAKPSGYVHPMAIRILKELNSPVDGLRSKSMDEFNDQKFETVITVCDRAKDACPVWPGAEMIHWGFEDPAQVKGTDEQKLAEFRKTATGLQQRIRLFLSVEKSQK
jgi:arsenate reductase